MHKITAMWNSCLHQVSTTRSSIHSFRNFSLDVLKVLPLGIHKSAWAAGLILASMVFPGQVYAALQLNSATLSVAAPAQGPASVVYVQGGGTITASVNGSTVGNTNWQATSWQVGAGAATCANHTNFNTNNSSTTISFTITAPAAAGTYDASFIAYSDNACTNNASNTLTLPVSVVVDNTPPSTTSINTADPNPTSAASVSWTVTFSESVVGVSAGNFTLVQAGGLSGAVISSVTGSGTTWTVTASTGTGSGTLGLDLTGAAGITDLAGNVLTGVPVTGGVYTVYGSTSVTVTGSPTLCVSDPSNGGTYAWGGLANVGAQDAVYASAQGRNSSVTEYLKCTGYGFNIPAGATISGITVGVWRYSRRTMSDQSMVLVKANVNQIGPVGTMDLATMTRFPGTNAQAIYGSATNLWGNTWTAADINDPNFGAAFAAVRGAFNTTDTAFVDYMPITIDYTIPPQPLATYHMDEAGWNGTANDVPDSSGNGNSAQSFNGANTDGISPAITGSPGTCRYGVFDNAGTITQGYVQTPLPDLTTDFTVTAWIRTTNNALTGQRILIDDQNNSGGYGISLGDGGAGRIRFYSRGITPIILDSTYTIANNIWYFVAAVADITNKMRTIYVFDAAGNLLNSTTEAAWTGGAWGTDPGPVSIGGETNASGEAPAGFHFHGNIDEVQVFNTPLTQASLAQIATQTHVCPVSLLDHIEIQSSASGLTCAANTLIIKACADAACTTLYTGGVVGTLSATGTGMTVNWDGTTGGATGAGFVIPAGSSSVTKNVQVATAGSVVFGIASLSPASVNAATCNFGAPACTFTANTAGFLFSDTSSPGSAYTVPAQVSGIATPTLYLRAVQAATSNVAVCTPAIVNSTTSVTMGYTCNDPATCQAGSLATITDVTTATPTAIASTGTSVNLSFDANGSAPITARYDDVGKITLNAGATITPFGGASAITLAGSSNAFVVAPHHFGFSAVTAAPITAGNNFAATVTAYNGLATPSVTPNFGLETAPATVTLSFSKCQPTGTNSSSGTFSGSLGSFASGGASSANLNWSEVGNIDLVATTSNYLGSGLSATGNTGTGGTVCNGAGNVGRFIPDHFDTVVTGPMTCPVGLTCPTGGLVYSGQSFTANVYARNAAGAVTQNYDGTANTSPNFAKAGTLTAWDALGSTTTQNPPAATPGSITAGSAIAATSFSKGATVSPGTPGAPVYTFGTIPTDQTDIYIRFADADGVSSLRAIPANSVEGGVKVVNGRVKVSNAYGSELLPLTLTATAQYYTASGWVNSNTDGSTTLSLAPSYTVGAGTTAASFVTPADAACLPYVSGTVCKGLQGINLAKPSGGATGAAIINPTIPSYMSLIPGTATFGVYKNNNNYIYRRER